MVFPVDYLTPINTWKVIGRVSLITFPKKLRNKLETLKGDQNNIIIPLDTKTSSVVLNQKDNNEKCLKIVCISIFYH